MTARQSSQVVTDSFSYVRGFGGVFCVCVLVLARLGLSDSDSDSRARRKEPMELSMSWLSFHLCVQTHVRPTPKKKKDARARDRDRGCCCCVRRLCEATDTDTVGMHAPMQRTTRDSGRTNCGTGVRPQYALTHARMSA